MPIFLQEDSKELNKQKFFLSKNGKNKLNAMITKMEAYGLQKNDGYKMLKHLQNDEYNQAEKKDEKLVKDPNVHTEQDKINKPQKGLMNKTVEGGIHRNKTSNDKIMHAFTDWVYGTNGELTLKHKSTQNRLDHTATKPLTPKKPKIEKPKQIKPINAKDGSQIHVVKEVKISNKQLNILKEYHNQLNIPFDEYGSEVNGYKLVYEQYIDFLESIGKYGKLPKENFTIGSVVETINQYLPNVHLINDIYYGDEEQFLYDIEDMLWKTQKGYYDYSDYFINYEEIKDFGFDELCEYYENNEILNDYGKREFLTDILDENGFPYGLEINENGLIYVERIINIPEISSTKEIYHKFKYEYDNVGECWSWAKGGAQDFGENNVLWDNKTTNIVLKGWVSPQSVDWEYTVSLNVSKSLGEERELRLISDEHVQIDEIEIVNGQFENKNIPLQNSIIVTI